MTSDTLRKRHPLVQHWLNGEEDAGGCICKLEEALAQAGGEIAKLNIAAAAREMALNWPHENPEHEALHPAAAAAFHPTLRVVSSGSARVLLERAERAEAECEALRGLLKRAEDNRDDAQALRDLLHVILAHWPKQEVLDSLEPDDPTKSRKALLDVAPTTAQLRQWRAAIAAKEKPNESN